MISTESPQIIETGKAKRRRERAASEAVDLARELSFRALAAISAIPTEGFPEDLRKSAAVHKRDIAEEIRRLRRLLPKQGG